MEKIVKLKNEMKRSTRKIFCLILWTCLLISEFSRSAWARAPSLDDSFLQEYHSLQSLKAKDPVAYREAIRQKKERLRETLKEFQWKRPEKFQAFLEKKKEFKRKRLEYFRQRYPQGFERFKEERRRRLIRLEQNHPERFHHFLATHPHLRERYERHVLEKDRRPFRPQAGFRRRRGHS